MRVVLTGAIRHGVYLQSREPGMPDRSPLCSPSSAGTGIQTSPRLAPGREGRSPSADLAPPPSTERDDRTDQLVTNGEQIAGSARWTGISIMAVGVSRLSGSASGGAERPRLSAWPPPSAMRCGRSPLLTRHLIVARLPILPPGCQRDRQTGAAGFAASPHRPSAGHRGKGGCPSADRSSRPP
jgi:hypothetical protein